MITQFQQIRHEINVLFDTGESDKKTIYTKLQEKTGLPRTTIRRCVRDLKIELNRKVQILSTKDYKRTVHTTTNAYDFIPDHIRYHFNRLLKNDFIQLDCIICDTPLGYLEKLGMEPIICSDCRDRFPESKRDKTVDGLEENETT